ncbi:hypothetical protein NDU88_007039 [Pleurodeles waltl]|uniref:Uncharacterized protein n=1 Tax=Pleurodeles waltl TaxID=8319 RepID=A0AAV7N2M7_PLEWA|nr:hypothetical protein NDU88_007039 [Pleurodeles waltl]
MSPLCNKATNVDLSELRQRVYEKQMVQKHDYDSRRAPRCRCYRLYRMMQVKESMKPRLTNQIKATRIQTGSTKEGLQCAACQIRFYDAPVGGRGDKRSELDRFRRRW